MCMQTGMYYILKANEEFQLVLKVTRGHTQYFKATNLCVILVKMVL